MVAAAIASVRGESKSSYRVAGRVMRADARSTDDESPNSVTNHGRQTLSLFTNEAGCLAARGEIERHVYLVVLPTEVNCLVAIMGLESPRERRTTLNYV